LGLLEKVGKDVQIGVSNWSYRVVVASERGNQLGGIALKLVVERQVWVYMAKTVGHLRQMLARVFFDRVELEHERVL
jgi:hypothetical protein